MAAPAQPQQEKTLLMTEGSIWKSILLFSVPLILGNLLQQLYNTADPSSSATFWAATLWPQSVPAAHPSTCSSVSVRAWPSAPASS